ncbi:hypothetical protein D9613_004171 [Agrocybe pediades]|uniref:Low temperature viability protein n=1 Tax=Agrocybe pediades TaxID=84607 RepID=A0A8H4VKL1_9AGAR|nr:hypothetical protein D9613_004171 [Agrocybe pediades]
MPPKSKSIFRQPGAQHFQLVHRSQRDPLINDPEASSHVLKPFERENAKKGKSRADLETLLAEEDLSNGRQNIGEASLYGVYFDDTEYDYMRHLRAVGVQEDGVESVLIEAPSTSQKKQSKRKTGIELLDLPDGVLASTSELPRTYESQQAIPESIAGFQPDLDAHLRQVLEALEDDAFVEDDLEDDFFAEIVADGERGSDEEFDFEFQEDGVDPEPKDPEDDGEETSWEKRFADFKKSQKESEGGSDDGYASEGGDTVGTLPAISVIGGKGKRRRKGTSEASGYSMSSSSMYRNEALQTLDERFDQMIAKEYNEEDEDDINSNSDEDSDEAPDLITSREDFDDMVNTFLNDFEILGRKMKPKMEGESGMEKLDTFRRAMGQDERVRIMNADEQEESPNDDDLFPEDKEEKDRWDCETILTTYTNLENHPRLIRARDPKPTPTIVLDRKTGMPSVLKKVEKEKTTTGRVSFAPTSDDTGDSDSDNETQRGSARTIARPRNESKEEKKARKAAVKAERQARRVEKKTTKEQFGAEVKDQKKRIVNKELRLKKL